MLMTMVSRIRGGEFAFREAFGYHLGICDTGVSVKLTCPAGAVDAGAPSGCFGSSGAVYNCRCSALVILPRRRCLIPVQVDAFVGSQFFGQGEAFTRRFRWRAVAAGAARLPFLRRRLFGSGRLRFRLHLNHRFWQRPLSVYVYFSFFANDAKQGVDGTFSPFSAPI